jgi:hypothetical protein
MNAYGRSCRTNQTTGGFSVDGEGSESVSISSIALRLRLTDETTRTRQDLTQVTEDSLFEIERTGRGSAVDGDSLSSDVKPEPGGVRKSGESGAQKWKGASFKED